MEERYQGLSGDAFLKELYRGIRIEETQKGVALFLPWRFSADTKAQEEPLCIYIKETKNKEYSYKPWGKITKDKAHYAGYQISDGGRTLAELKKKVGNLAPYKQKIDYIVKSIDAVLAGGREIVLEYAGEGYNHAHYLQLFLGIVAHIAHLDILPLTYEDVRGNGI